MNIIIMLETNKKIKILIKNVEDIKNDQVEISELKDTVTKLKKLRGRIEEGISDYEVRQYQWTYPKSQLEKKNPEPQKPVGL